MILAVFIVVIIFLICSCVAVAEWLAPRKVVGCVCDRCSWYQHRRSFELRYAPYIPLYKTPAPLTAEDFKYDSKLKKFKFFKDRFTSQIEIDLIEKMSNEITREIDNDIFIQWLVEDAVRSGFAQAEAEFSK